MKVNVDDYIINTLKEDITSEDVSTNAVMPEDKKGCARLICKQSGILCGLDVFIRTFRLLDENSYFETEFKDGDKIEKGTLIGTVYGDIKALLSGERTALNYLQRMSGIATMTREYADELEGYKTTLLDTRKTTPNMRPFEKHAVRIGGGTNHRYNLSDGVLLKDNHIGAAGSITKAIEMAKAYAPFVRKIEIETETLEQVEEAVAAGADIIMLDNMDNETMKKAVEIIGGRAETECSGNVTKERLREIAEIGVDFVSCGALTHSAPILDFSLKNLKPIE
ncbi:MAG: carboxylating nicotinate-nucleotide diphosphorylase [Eubacterium sp.]|nr:carboxylating nicotinate-nucleotide diphosphorylase [Eubacterium sp.]MBR7061258.1 carboxylating nicotinate-nucleotide diphosphorylase [Eubacterium sp.]